MKLTEYRDKKESIDENRETFLITLVNTTGKISASGFSNIIPGINLTGKGTADSKGEMTKFEFFS